MEAYHGSAATYPDTITREYDVLGRLTEETTNSKFFSQTTATTNPLGYAWDFPYYSPSGLTVAGDSRTFTYDAMGNMLTANNQHAHVTRSYSLNGALLTDQQAIKNYGSGSFTNHVYDLSYHYDRDGVAALVLYTMRGFQNGRSSRYYLTWVLAGLIGFGTGLALDGLQPEDPLVMGFLGAGGGLACGLLFHHFLSDFPSIQPLPLPDD